VNYYERHLGDYARDTGHLSALEHGVYTLLLDRYYATERGVPKDQVYRVARAHTKPEREAVEAVLGEFFTLDGDTYVQDRVQREIARAHVRIDAARENGKTGGRPKKNPPGYRSGSQKEPTGLSVGSKNITQQKALQTPDTKHQSPEEGSLRSPSCAPDLARETFEACQDAYPNGLHRGDHWLLAEREVSARLEEGATPESLIQAARDYCAQQTALGNLGRNEVKRPHNFFGRSGAWRGPFPLPPTKAQQQQDANLNASREWLERAHAAG
jgi:uncharacterized protein YdaU (DUF1376 family)